MQICRRTRRSPLGYVPEGKRLGGANIRLFLDNCPADCLKICDINLRQKYYTKATIRESLRRADILKLKMIILTKGINGSVVLWKGASIPQAHALAVQVSAYVCTQKGAMPVIPEDLIH